MVLMRSKYDWCHLTGEKTVRIRDLSSNPIDLWQGGGQVSIHQRARKKRKHFLPLRRLGSPGARNGLRPKDVHKSILEGEGD